MAISIGDWLQKSRQTIKDPLDAQVLLAHMVSQSRTWVLAHPEYQINDKQESQLGIFSQHLVDGKPLAYITGYKEFYGLDFFVSPGVLIPRPETELIVEQAHQWLCAFTGSGKMLAADIGTGTGCIAISLAKTMPGLKIIATDISPTAITTAERNVTHHHVQDQVTLIRSDLMLPLIGTFNLICANLPYIPSQTLASLDVEKYEPTLALDGGPNGFDLIRKLLASVTRKLANHNLMLLEIEAAQGPLALQIGQQYFPQADIQVLTDLAGRDRVLRIENHAR